MPRTLPLLLLSLLPACTDTTDDGLLPGATPLECDEPEVRRFRIDRVIAPTSADEARAAGVDLDGADPDADNQLGNVFSALTGLAFVPELQARFDARFADDVDWMIDIARCGDAVHVTLAGGAIPAAGTIADGRIVADGGIALAPVGAFFDFGDLRGNAGWHVVYPASIHVTIEDGRLTGKVAGALAPGYVAVAEDAALPWIQAGVEAGDEDMIGVFDENLDGTVTAEELHGNDVVDALLRPDIDALGTRSLAPPDAPAVDGEADSLSFGFRITATEVDPR